MKILDNILRSNGYEMLAKEYKKINVTSFLESIKDVLFVHEDDKENDQNIIVCDKRNSEIESKEEPSLKAL